MFWPTGGRACLPEGPRAGPRGSGWLAGWAIRAIRADGGQLLLLLWLPALALYIFGGEKFLAFCKIVISKYCWKICSYTILHLATKRTNTLIFVII